MGNQQSSQAAGQRQKVDGIVVVLLGCTGAGKSTLGNVLLGKRPNDETGFKTLAGLESCNEPTVFKTGRWLGREDKPIVTIVDTPGFSDSRPGATDSRNFIQRWFDTKSRDTMQREEMAKVLKESIGAVHVFLWVRKAGERFTDNDRAYFSLYLKTFGKDEFQKRLIMVLTK